MLVQSGYLPESLAKITLIEQSLKHNLYLCFDTSCEWTAPQVNEELCYHPTFQSLNVSRPFSFHAIGYLNNVSNEFSNNSNQNNSRQSTHPSSNPLYPWIPRCFISLCPHMTSGEGGEFNLQKLSKKSIEVYDIWLIAWGSRWTLNYYLSKSVSQLSFDQICKEIFNIVTFSDPPEDIDVDARVILLTT